MFAVDILPVLAAIGAEVDNLSDGKSRGVGQELRHELGDDALYGKVDRKAVGHVSNHGPPLLMATTMRCQIDRDISVVKQLVAIPMVPLDKEY